MRGFKKISIVAIGIFVLFLTIAFIQEYNLHKSIQTELSELRLEKGIYTSATYSDTIETFWNDFFPENSLLRWKWILTNEEIPTSTIFRNDSLNDKAYHHTKTTYYSSYLTFWKNGLGGEVDIFINPVNEDTSIILEMTYHFNEYESEDNFICYLDTIATRSLENKVCGNKVLDYESDSTFFKGNIEKAKADEILIEWKIK